VPPWADSLPAESDDANQQDADEGGTDVVTEAAEIALPRRFRDARVALGRFTQTGDGRQLQRSLGHYVANGYGGANRATRRMAATTRTAGRLNDVLSQLSGVDGIAALDAALASAADTDTIMDAIVQATRPVDGTLDTETTQRSIYNALADLLVEFPDADLLALEESQRWFVIERYVVFDVFDLFCRDMMRTIMAKAADHLTGLARLDQIRSYIREVVAASFRSTRERRQAPASSTVARFVRDALADTFAVFEGYLA
jgi:hypothetical protein